MDAIRGAQEVSQRRPRGELNPRRGGEGGPPPLHVKFSRDAAISRIPAPHLLKQGQLQLAGASFREKIVLHFEWCTGTSTLTPYMPVHMKVSCMEPVFPDQKKTNRRPQATDMEKTVVLVRNQVGSGGRTLETTRGRKYTCGGSIS